MPEYHAGLPKPFEFGVFMDGKTEEIAKQRVMQHVKDYVATLQEGVEALTLDDIELLASPKTADT